MALKVMSQVRWGLPLIWVVNEGMVQDLMGIRAALKTVAGVYGLLKGLYCRSACIGDRVCDIINGLSVTA